MSQTPPDDVVLRVDRVSKTYRLWSSPGQRLWVPLLLRLARLLKGLPLLANALQRHAHAGLHVHDALQPISFTLRRGEALGIIGANGSGKSTLLQIVAGVLEPTTGSAEVHGRVAALLELGSGFNPELTGRENIRINAAILGLTPRQIDERMAAIIAFADIGDYVDQPVKAYSSGMAVRLAFAVQVHIDPDVLIVDEALAVGDAAFQAKAIARIDEILRRGTTLLFVGHDLNAVRSFCHSAMLLERGRVVATGLPDEVALEYLERSRAASRAAQRELAHSPSTERIDRGYAADEPCVVEGALNGGRHAVLAFGERVDVNLQVRLTPELTHPLLVLDVLDTKGLQLSGRRIWLEASAEVSTVDLAIAFDAILQRGIYWLRMRLVNEPNAVQATVVARQQGWLSFEVGSDSRDRFVGLFPLAMSVDTLR